MLERWLYAKPGVRFVWGASFCNFLDPSELKVIGCVFFDDFHALG